MTQLLTGWDDANVNQFAGLVDPSFVFGGYVDNYVTFPWLLANRRSNRLISISLYGNPADCYDMENGGGSPANAPAHWHRWYANRAHMHTAKPVMYTMAGECQQVINALANAGIGRSSYLLWSAHVGRGLHVCAPNVCGYPAADGTQWTWTALGRSLDQSALSSAFFDGGSAPTPSTMFTEDSLVIIDNKTAEVPVALPVGATWLTLFANQDVGVNVTLAGAKPEELNLKAGVPQTIATNGKRGARVFKKDAAIPVGVTYA